MNNVKTKSLDVVAYIRKSSEDNEKGEANKQVNSLKYQRDFVNEALKKYNLRLAHATFEDDKTGYEAFVRDNFGKMLDYLKEKEGQIDGIVCTEISRLARNFADGGMILWYLQSGVIKNIYTPTKVFTNSSSDQLMVAIEFAMSKKSSDEGSYRTKAGMKTKAFTMKHPPRPPVIGYITEGLRGKKEWKVDPDKGPLVKQVFIHYSTGNYNFEEIANLAYNIGLRSTSSKSKTGKISKNTWQLRLQDIKYTGIFEYEGEKVAGEYKPLVDSELFYRVQEVMSDKQHPKVASLDYAYSGLVKCGLCGGNFSGTHKKGITYYRCAKRQLPCKGRKSDYVREDVLEESILESLAKIEIDQETWKAAKDYVSELNQPQRINIKKQIRELTGKIGAEEALQIKVNRKYTNGEITRVNYLKLLDDSEQKINSLRNTLVKCDNIINELDSLLEEFLDNVKHVTKRLKTALPHNKREMVDIFCENLVWDGEKVRFDWKKPYFALANRTKSSNVLPR